MSCNNCGNLINGGRSDSNHLCDYPNHGVCKESSYMTPTRIATCAADYRHGCYAGHPDFRAYPDCNDCPQKERCFLEHANHPPKEADPIPEDVAAIQTMLKEGGIPLTDARLRYGCIEVPIKGHIVTVLLSTGVILIDNYGKQWD